LKRLLTEVAGRMSCAQTVTVLEGISGAAYAYVANVHKKNEIDTFKSFRRVATRVLIKEVAARVPSAHHGIERNKKMKTFLMRLWKEEEGQDLVEYGLLVALVALAATAGMNALASAINVTFSALGSKLTVAT
jgi:pilus assembly protein Flp/PilA